MLLSYYLNIQKLIHIVLWAVTFDLVTMKAATQNELVWEYFIKYFSSCSTLTLRYSWDIHFPLIHYFWSAQACLMFAWKSKRYTPGWNFSLLGVADVHVATLIKWNILREGKWYEVKPFIFIISVTPTWSFSWSFTWDYLTGCGMKPQPNIYCRYNN